MQVVLPLVAAPLCVLVVRARAAWVIAQAASAAALAVAVALLVRVLADGPWSYLLGGWAAPWGIEYRVDALNALVLVLVAAASTLMLPFSARSIEREVRPSRHSLFYAAWMLVVTGMLGMTVTGDAFNVFVFLEITSLSSYVLVAIGRDRRALVAALRYLVMGTVGGTFFLIGVGLLYALTGTLNMADLAARLPAVAGRATLEVAFAFMVVGLGLKMALFPLHGWMPNAYTFAPSAVGALIASTATKVAVYVLLRFLFTVFGGDLAAGLGATRFLLPLALAGMLLASLAAIFQSHARRVLAYSSVAQIGYIALGIATLNVTGISAAVVHLVNHGMMKGALFLALGCVYYRTRTLRIDEIAGIGRRMPWTMGAFTVAAASLVGVPLSAGFVSKWWLLQAVLERGWWPAAALIVITSLMALVYLGRIVEAAYFREPAAAAARVTGEAPLAMLLPTWLLAAANLYFGIDTALTAAVARGAASALLGAAP